MRLSHDIPARSCRCVFTLLMMLAWCAAPQGNAQEPAVRPPATAPAVSPAQLADSLERAVNLYTKIDRDLPRDTFDPRAIVQKVGNDPDALFAWVRDNTSYIPYRGALRGAMGVLMDRSGNSLDRSLLLGTLLQFAGHKARLAHGRLEPARADALLKQTWEDPKSGPATGPDPQPIDDATIARVSNTYGMDPAAVRRGAEQRTLQLQATAEELVGAATEQSEALATLVGPLPANDNRRDEQLAAVADHWWIQVSADSKWVDLDPATRDSKPGDASVAASQTCELPENGVLPADPGVERQEVDLRVQIERYDKGVATKELVLEQPIRPAELFGRPVQLQLAPTDWPENFDPTTGDPNEKLKATLLAQQNWVPVLKVGEQTVIQKGFNVHGVVDPKPKLDPLAKTGGSASSAAQAAADLFGDKPAEAVVSELTAAWIELEIRVPGQKPRVIRRDLFDALGPAARRDHPAADIKFDDTLRLKRATGLYRQTDLLAIGCVASGAFVQHLAMSNLIANGPVLIKALRESGTKPPKDSLKTVATIKQLPAAILALAAARRGPVGAGTALAVDRPNLFALNQGFAIDSSGKMDTRLGIDIVANETSVRGTAGADAFKLKLTQGVLETAMERTAVGRPRASVNPVTLFAASDAQKVEWVKVASADDPQLSRLALSPDTLARIREDLTEGYTVVAPRSPVSTGGLPREGWWRIDPREGSCIGFGADGTGPEMAEYAIVLGSVLLESYMAYRCIKGGGYALGCVVCGAAAVIADILSLGFGAEVGAALAISGSEFGFARACEAAIAE